MLRFVSRRILETALALLGTSLVVFAMIHMIPGDPALLMAGLEAGPEVVERIRRELGLEGFDDVFGRQYRFGFVADPASTTSHRASGT